MWPRLPSRYAALAAILTLFSRVVIIVPYEIYVVGTYTDCSAWTTMWLVIVIEDVSNSVQHNLCEVYETFLTLANVYYRTATITHNETYTVH